EPELSTAEQAESEPLVAGQVELELPDAEQAESELSTAEQAELELPDAARELLVAALSEVELQEQAVLGRRHAAHGEEELVVEADPQFYSEHWVGGSSRLEPYSRSGS